MLVLHSRKAQERSLATEHVLDIKSTKELFAIPEVFSHVQRRSTAPRADGPTEPEISCVLTN